MLLDLTIKKAKEQGTLDSFYERRVHKLIRQRYSLNDELAILRQRDTKPDEFKAYNDYVEQCKAKVKALIGD